MSVAGKQEKMNYDLMSSLACYRFQPTHSKYWRALFGLAAVLLGPPLGVYSYEVIRLWLFYTARVRELEQRQHS